MAEPIPYQRIDKWVMFGRGRTLQFWASVQEVQEWLLAELPHAYGPYEFIGGDLVKDRGHYVQAPFRHGITDLQGCSPRREDNLSSPRRIFLWAHALTPDREMHRGENIQGFCSLNGMIHLLLGMGFVSSMQIVPSIIHVKTREKRSHDEYLDVFCSLKKAIRRNLIWTSVYEHGWEGNIEDKKRLMTEGAARLHEACSAFKVRPGHRVKK